MSGDGVWMLNDRCDRDDVKWCFILICVFTFSNLNFCVGWRWPRQTHHIQDS